MSYVDCYTWRGVTVDSRSEEPYVEIDVSENLIDILINKITEEITQASKSCNSLEGIRQLNIATDNLRQLLTAKDAFREFRIEEMSKPVEEPEVNDEG